MELRYEKDSEWANMLEQFFFFCVSYYIKNTICLSIVFIYIYTYIYIYIYGENWNVGGMLQRFVRWFLEYMYNYKCIHMEIYIYICIYLFPWSRPWLREKDDLGPLRLHPTGASGFENFVRFHGNTPHWQKCHGHGPQEVNQTMMVMTWGFHGISGRIGGLIYTN